MGFLFILVMLGGALAMLTYAMLDFRSKWNRRVSHIAQHYGLEAHKTSWRSMGFLRLQGTVGRLGVELEMPNRVPARHDRQQGFVEQLANRRDDRPWHYARAVVTLPARLQLRFGPEAATSIGRFIAREDLQIGDPTFDDVVRLGGDETVLRSTFDPPVRWAARLVVERGGTCDGQRLELAWRHEDNVFRDEEMLDLLLDAARALAERPGTARARLAALVASDEKATVRRNVLRFMLDRHAAAPETAEALDRALGDSDPEVRGVAAIELNDLKVLEGLLPPGPPVPTRIAAAEQLGRSDAGLRILRGVVGRLDGEVRAAAVNALKAAGGVETGGLALVGGDAGGLALSDSGEPTD